MIALAELSKVMQKLCVNYIKLTMHFSMLIIDVIF